MRLFLIFSLGLIISSCSDIRKKEQLLEIDTLLEQADSMLRTCTVDVSIEKELISQGDSVKSLLCAIDTLEHSVAADLDTFFTNIQLARDFSERITECRIEVKQRKTQLRRLKRQVELQEGRRDLYDEQIQFEQDQLEILKKQIDDLTEAHQKAGDTNREIAESIHENLRNFSVLTEE